MKRNLLTLAGAALCLMSCSLSVFAGGTQVAPVPEPATILLVAGAGGALFVIRKLRNKK